MYKLCFFVPDDSLERVKAALFKTGAGKIGNYDQCCWQVKGTGQFRPLSGSVPAMGEHGECTTLDEWKVELVCEDKLIKTVVAALIAAHPYEEVAYQVIHMVDPGEVSTG